MWVLLICGWAGCVGAESAVDSDISELKAPTSLTAPQEVFVFSLVTNRTMMFCVE